MDQMVLKTQKWLNLNYKNKNGYNLVSENGTTGWPTIYGLTRALQIELGISDPADNFGPTTMSLFNPLSVNSNPTSSDKSATAISKKNQIFILQGSLWCKGYSPNGFTGCFGDDTKKAIMQFQSDAGLSSQDGIVTATIMKSLLSMDAFKLLNYGEYYGDQNIRVIQQNLNCDYSSNKYFSSDLGLIPCDGIYERKTNKALIYALQIEEGISEPTGYFGPLTREKCPYLTLGSESKFVKLLQFALYCNGPEYDPTAFTGYYGNNTQKSVLLFQNFTCLSSSGNAGMQTWSSLLTSTGDTSRKGTMCDCATTITAAKAQTLKTNGYKSVGRYLTGKFKMTQPEINTILSAGINIFPIMETGGYELPYFTLTQGNLDAKAAIKTARDFGFDADTIIYFTVDFDALDGDVTSSILPYFSEIYGVFKRTKTKYKIGIYAPRNVCTRISKAGYSCSSFVCDMSSGFSGNLGYPLPKDWAIDQISTITIGTGDGLIEIDNNISSGLDLGVSKINLGNNASGIPDPYIPSPSIPITPSIPLSNGFEYIIVSGKEKLIEGGNPRYKYNFIETALRKLNDYSQDRKNIPLDSSVRLNDKYTWLVHRYEYSATDFANFKVTAGELNCTLVIFDSNEQFINYLNTGSINGTGSRNILIKEFTIFCHGHVGDICFSTQSDSTDTEFYISDISKLNKKVFYNPKFEFYSCNASTGTINENDPNQSFGYAWAQHLGYSSLKSCFHKTDYNKISTSDLAERAIYGSLRKKTGYIQSGSFHYPCPDLNDPTAKWVYTFHLTQS